MWESIKLGCQVQHSKIVHFDYQPQRIYYAISQYVEVEGHGYVLEYKLKMHDDIFKNDKQYQNMLKTLNYMQESMYLDGLTEVYNRRYLEDEMLQKEEITSVLPGPGGACLRRPAGSFCVGERPPSSLRDATSR